MMKDILVCKASAEVLDYLLDFEKEKFSTTDIMKTQQLNYLSVKKAIQPLIHFGLVKSEGKEGKANLYSLNQESEIFIALKVLDFAISKTKTELPKEPEASEPTPEPADQPTPPTSLPPTPEPAPNTSEETEG